MTTERPRRSGDIVLVTTGRSGSPLLATGRVRGVDVYDLEGGAILGCRALLVGMHADQRELRRLEPSLSGLLDRGGTLVFSGHVAHPFLPELEPWVPIPDYRLDDLRVHRVADHPVWAGVRGEDLTFRRGVAGFYGRGHNPSPPGAEVLNALGFSRRPVDWILERPGGGTLLVHGGNDFWHFGAHGSGWGDSSARLGPQLLDWLDGRAR